MKDAGGPVKVRFLMLEGWQTLHDFVRTRFDCNFGFYSTPAEMPHFELVVPRSGEPCAFRHDPGYVPQPASQAQLEFVGRILWEAYGVMMRVEADRGLPLKFASDRAIFARVERSPGEWADEPLQIPDPPPHVEKVSFPQETVKAAKDLPIVPGYALEVDFGLRVGLATQDARPRSVYALVAVDARTGEAVIDSQTAIGPDGGLRALWESMPPRLLMELVAGGRIPGEVKVRSGRVFRLLRPLCIELPFKLSLHERLEHMQ